MKKRNIIKPTGLKGKEVINRMKELMGSTSINEDVKRSVVELTKEGPDGNIYAIVRENQEYYIKISENKSNLVTEDFNYIGGLQNKKDKSFSSYSKAIKQLNLKFMSLNEAIGKSGQINVFEDDNLITEHHPLKADMKLSADKGIGDGAEYVVDKKGAELKYDNKEGKDADGFGDNVADSTAEKDIEEVKLNETETAIDEMITGEEVIEEGGGKYFTVRVGDSQLDGVIDAANRMADFFPNGIHKRGNNYVGFKTEDEKEDFLQLLDNSGIEYKDFGLQAGDIRESVKEEEAPKKGFSIARAIQEMDDVIDEISGDDKIDTILESLGEEERAIMMEALKKKV